MATKVPVRVPLSVQLAGSLLITCGVFAVGLAIVGLVGVASSPSFREIVAQFNFPRWEFWFGLPNGVVFGVLGWSILRGRGWARWAYVIYIPLLWAFFVWMRAAGRPGLLAIGAYAVMCLALFRRAASDYFAIGAKRPPTGAASTDAGRRSIARGARNMNTRRVIAMLLFLAPVAQLTAATFEEVLAPLTEAGSPCRWDGTPPQSLEKKGDVPEHFYAYSIQAVTLYYAEEIAKAVNMQPMDKRAESYACGDEKATIFLYKYADDVEAWKQLDGFKTLIWGSTSSSYHHPEAIYQSGDVIVVVSGKHPKPFVKQLRKNVNEAQEKAAQKGFEKTAELKEFARRYTAAWCRRNPASVAQFYAPRGSLKINDGPASVGRAAITTAVQGFMTTFPDLVVTMDELSFDGSRAVYRWTAAGTNTGPGGTGKAVRFSGYEEWTMGADGLIATSNGHFDEAEYQRQLKVGAE